MAILDLLICVPKWRNRQTRTTQNSCGVNPCGFDSHLRHTNGFFTHFVVHTRGFGPARRLSDRLLGGETGEQRWSFQ